MYFIPTFQSFNCQYTDCLSVEKIKANIKAAQSQQHYDSCSNKVIIRKS